MFTVYNGTHINEFKTLYSVLPLAVKSFFTSPSRRSILSANRSWFLVKCWGLAALQSSVSAGLSFFPPERSLLSAGEVVHTSAPSTGVMSLLIWVKPSINRLSFYQTQHHEVPLVAPLFYILLQCCKDSEICSQDPNPNLHSHSH